jgi:PAS domain-containing protein
MSLFPLQPKIDWKAHLEALPLATWIVRCERRSDQRVGLACGPLFANQACRDALGLRTSVGDLENGYPGRWHDYLHPEDSQSCLQAWKQFLEGRTPRFQQTLRWIRPDTKEVISLAVRAQKLLCGDIQGWLRSTAAEAALSRLEELTHVRR